MAYRVRHLEERADSEQLARAWERLGRQPSRSKRSPRAGSPSTLRAGHRQRRRGPCWPTARCSRKCRCRESSHSRTATLVTGARRQGRVPRTRLSLAKVPGCDLQTLVTQTQGSTPVSLPLVQADAGVDKDAQDRFFQFEVRDLPRGLFVPEGNRLAQCRDVSPVPFVQQGRHLDPCSSDEVAGARPHP